MNLNNTLSLRIAKRLSLLDLHHLCATSKSLRAQFLSEVVVFACISNTVPSMFFDRDIRQHPHRMWKSLQACNNACIGVSKPTYEINVLTRLFPEAENVAMFDYDNQGRKMYVESNAQTSMSIVEGRASRVRWLRCDEMSEFTFKKGWSFWSTPFSPSGVCELAVFSRGDTFRLVSTSTLGVCVYFDISPPFVHVEDGEMVQGCLQDSRTSSMGARVQHKSNEGLYSMESATFLKHPVCLANDVTFLWSVACPADDQPPSRAVFTWSVGPTPCVVSETMVFVVELNRRESGEINSLSKPARVHIPTCVVDRLDACTHDARVAYLLSGNIRLNQTCAIRIQAFSEGARLRVDAATTNQLCTFIQNGSLAVFSTTHPDWKPDCEVFHTQTVFRRKETNVEVVVELPPLYAKPIGFVWRSRLWIVSRRFEKLTETDALVHMGLVSTDCSPKNTTEASCRVRHHPCPPFSVMTNAVQRCETNHWHFSLFRNGSMFVVSVHRSDVEIHLTWIRVRPSWTNPSDVVIDTPQTTRVPLDGLQKKTVKHSIKAYWNGADDDNNVYDCFKHRFLTQDTALISLYSEEFVVSIINK